MQETFVFVSHNSHKALEINAMLESTNPAVVSLDQAGLLQVKWEELGKTFRANATAKILAARKYTSLPLLADDSGLMVMALGNEPGVHSSHYGGEEGNSQKNMDKLLEKMASLKENQRKAAFVCCLASCRKNAEIDYFYGLLPGSISQAPQGKNGFGYDPIFYLPLYHKTLAELTDQQKNQMSHRFRALLKWSTWIKNHPKH